MLLSYLLTCELCPASTNHITLRYTVSCVYIQVFMEQNRSMDQIGN